MDKNDLGLSLCLGRTFEWGFHLLQLAHCVKLPQTLWLGRVWVYTDINLTLVPPALPARQTESDWRKASCRRRSPPRVASALVETSGAKLSGVIHPIRCCRSPHDLESRGDQLPQPSQTYGWGHQYVLNHSSTLR